MRFFPLGEPRDLRTRLAVIGVVALAMGVTGCTSDTTNSAEATTPDEAIDGSGSDPTQSNLEPSEPSTTSDDPCSAAYLDESLIFLENNTFYMREPLATLIRDRNTPDCYDTTFTDAEPVDRRREIDEPGELLRRLGIVSGAQIDLPRRLDSALISSRGWSYLVYDDASAETQTVFVGIAPNEEQAVRSDLLAGVRSIQGEGQLQVASTVAGVIFVDGDGTGMTAPTRHFPIALGSHTVQLCVVPGQLTPPVSIEVVDDSAIPVVFDNATDDTTASEACAEAIAGMDLPVVDACNAIELTLSTAIRDIGPLTVEVPARAESDWSDALNCAPVRLIPREEDDGTTFGIFGARSGTVWSALGFRNGDRLSQIDGQPVSADLAATLAAAFASPRETIRIQLERRGVVAELQLNVTAGPTED